MRRRVSPTRTRRALVWCASVAAWPLLAAAPAHGQVTLTAGALAVSVSAQGEITALRSTATGKNYRYAGTPSPVLTLVHGGARLTPTAMQLSTARGTKTLTLRYAGDVRIAVRVRETAAYVAFEIVRAVPSAKVEAVIWGPYATTIGHTVGEVVGVVQDREVALGLQVLNAKTLGGDLPNREGSTWARGIAARPQAWGSFLNAYAINRERERTVDGWGGDFPNMPVPPIAGETVVGSAIALFLVPASQALDAMERIEVAEGLPYPTINGVWFRKSPLYERSYMISDFGEAEVDEMIGYARRSGLYSLYHEGPFKSWGHFVLDSARWPSGRPGLKAAVAKARAAGLHFGVHTLTNFINTNDPYVTPVPDERLAVTGTSILVSAVDARQTELEVRSPEYFANDKHDNLHTVRIGAELIQYRAVTATAPYRLLDCQRGAFGTTPAAHAAGASVGKLLDHPYKVFFPNFAMQREVARNLADFLNETGVDHIDFDGHEGALASGQGDFALAVFANDVLSQVRHDLINGTSISKTFYWHIGSYYNWGEPWYGGFAESMQQYRIDNQALFARNFMPHMLGWYLLTETTTHAEMEWMLARAAGYGAGFAMVARPKALRGNPRTSQLLDAIREWESARTGRAFDSAQVARLKDPAREFHLERVADGAWRLHEMAMSPVFTRARVERQPGEPTHTEWRVDQPWDEQRLQFRLRVTSIADAGTARLPAAGNAAGAVRALRLTVDRYAALALPVELRAGESLVVDGTDIVRLYDATGKPKGRLALGAWPPVLAPGAHVFQMESDFDGDGLAIEVQFRGMGAAEPVRARR